MEAPTSQNDSGAAPVAAPAPASAPAPAKTATQALESAARSAATPVPAAGAQPNGAVAPPVPAATEQAQPVDKKGPIPFDVHHTALQNARTKAAEEAVQQYAWANGLDPEEVKDAIRLRTRLFADSKKFHQELGAELEGPDDSLPEADLVSSDGKIKTYSAAAFAKAAEKIRQQVLREVGAQIQPLLTEREQAQQREQEQQATRAQAADIKNALTHARTLPHFKENEKAISAKLGEIPKAVRQKVGLIGAMYMAYSAVLADRGQVAGTEAEQRVVSDFKRKATAGVGNASPGGAVPAPSKQRPKNAGELARHMERLSQRPTQ